MKVKFVEKDNLHISLKFLGDLNSKEIEKTLNMLQNISTKYQHFIIGLSENVGIFPDNSRPRVIWVGIEKGNDIVSNIHQSIEKELRLEPFFQKENKFRAHITMARLKNLKYSHKLNDYIKNIKINPVTDFVKTIELMESQLTTGGPIYKTINSFPLLIQT